MELVQQESFTVYYKPCCSNSSSAVKVRTLPWEIRKEEQGYMGFLSMYSWPLLWTWSQNA